jgi:hypothetical protein
MTPYVAIGGRFSGFKNSMIVVSGLATAPGKRGLDKSTYQQVSFPGLCVCTDSVESFSNVVVVLHRSEVGRGERFQQESGTSEGPKTVLTYVQLPVSVAVVVILQRTPTR